jgi:hypothetical protein
MNAFLSRKGILLIFVGGLIGFICASPLPSRAETSTCGPQCTDDCCSKTIEKCKVGGLKSCQKVIVGYECYEVPIVTAPSATVAPTGDTDLGEPEVDTVQFPLATTTGTVYQQGDEYYFCGRDDSAQMWCLQVAGQTKVLQVDSPPPAAGEDQDAYYEDQEAYEAIEFLRKILKVKKANSSILKGAAKRALPKH